MKLDKIIAVRNNKTVYRDGDLCLKVFGADYSKADVLNEALNQARVEETGLNIPRVREVTVADGKWTIVSDYIAGKTLADLMLEEPDKKDEYLRRLCRPSARRADMCARRLPRRCPEWRATSQGYMPCQRR